MKHIKLFNESDNKEIDMDRLTELITELTDLTVTLHKKNKYIDSTVNELSNFTDRSKSKNDQIADSIANLQLVKKSLEDATNKLDTVVNNIKDYNFNGRKYLY